MDTDPAVDTTTATLTRAERRRRHREERAASVRRAPQPSRNRRQRRDLFGPPPAVHATHRLPRRARNVLAAVTPTSGQARVNAKRLDRAVFWANAYFDGRLLTV
ncbi:hypothetical protein [Streptomyces sp. NRRL S-350]|uniref:hypothetical protein n=1 Tax=Streptomyces sp. NRRL S-350 TaxID=1463902 RepID=UPI0004BF4E5B|nr:hypothetical protein [Streptomyces sp. NRRL S-350]